MGRNIGNWANWCLVPIKKRIDLSLYGQRIDGIKIPVGSSVAWYITCRNPFTRLPLDLTNVAVIMDLAALDLAGIPIIPPITTKSILSEDPHTGTCVIEWDPADTIIDDVPLTPKSYYLDIWIKDADGNRLTTQGFSVIELTPSGATP